MPSAKEIAHAKAELRKARQPNIDWADAKAVEALVKRYPFPQQHVPDVGDMLKVTQTAPRATRK